MKKTTIVMIHQENQAYPMDADEARVSMVRIAQTVKRTRSKRPRTRSKAGASRRGAGTELTGAGSYRKCRRRSDFRSRARRFLGPRDRLLFSVQPRPGLHIMSTTRTSSIRLKTALPGPRSLALPARRDA